MNFQERYQYDAQKDLLGKGGFSTVYLAKDKLLDRFVALKFFKNQDLHKYDVLTEIRKVIQLEHPNITRYYDVVTLENRTVHGEIEKLQVGIMEYINGGDIASFLQKYPNEFDSLIRQVLQGIQYLHNNNIIHRDLKPQNILIKNQDGLSTAKITDFGISKVVDSNSTSTHGLLGTLAYMSPEQLDPKSYGIDGKISTNLDFWSFGILLYGLLTNTHPFIDNNSNTAEQILRNILMADISSKINTVENPIYRTMLEKCLVKNANKRVKSASDLLNIKPTKGNFEKLDEPQKVIVEAVKNQDNPVNDQQIHNEKSDNNKNISIYKFIFMCIVMVGLTYWYFKVPETNTNNNEIQPITINTTSKGKIHNDSLIIYGGKRDSLTKFRSNGKHGFADQDNNIIIDAEYDMVSPFSEGFSEVRKNNKSGFIDMRGNVTIPIIYDHVGYFHEGIVGIWKNNKWGYVDKNGNEIIPCIYDHVDRFSEGLAFVRTNGKRMVIDRNNNVLFSLNEDGINHDFHEGLATIEQDGMWGFIDKTGKIVIPCIYKYADDFYEGLAQVEKYGKLGYIDQSGKLTIDFKYDQTGYVHLFRNGYAEVSKKGKLLRIDKNGNEYPSNK